MATTELLLTAWSRRDLVLFWKVGSRDLEKFTQFVKRSFLYKEAIDHDSTHFSRQQLHYPTQEIMVY